ncbi:MAG: glycoside hydrolase family 25 protein [Polyangiaceae bacterium]
MKTEVLTVRALPLLLWSVPLLAFAQAGCTTNNGEQSRGEHVDSTSEAVTKDCDGADSGVYGVDVFDGQGTINWVKFKQANADGGSGDGGKGDAFAFIKATQGNYTTESTFKTNWTNAKAAGVLRSAYHFYDASRDGAAQAAYFLNVVGSDIGELPPMLDIECPTASTKGASQSNCEYTGNSGFPADGGISALPPGVFAWLDAIEKATGKKAIVYSYVSWFASTNFTDTKLAKYPLFISNVSTSCPTVPAPWSTVTFWQYQTVGGTAPGISGDCDLDRWMGDLSSLNAFAFGVPDAGIVDSGTPIVVDASPPVVESDSGAPIVEAEASASGDDGCSCDVVGAHPEKLPGGAVAIMALGLTVVRRRSRRCA